MEACTYRASGAGRWGGPTRLKVVLLAGVLVTLAGCGSSPDRANAPRSTAAAAREPIASIAIDATVTPDRAGTEAHPQGVRVGLDLRLGAPRDVDPPQLSYADVQFPAGFRYGGAGFPSCRQQTLERDGAAGCPAGSVVGHGTAVVLVDTARTEARITVVNGGVDKLFYYTVMDHPARVEAPIVGTISKLDAPWAYRLHLVVPRKLQVVAGVPVALRELRISAGAGTWLASTSCPGDHAWHVRAQAAFENGERIERQTSVACR
jgi:hypothetical protein